MTASSGYHRNDNGIDMTTLDDEKLVTVAERSSELAASVVVSVLQDAGIRAVATGGFTAGFKAEAPGWVKIQTFQRDAERAREVIAEIKQEPVQWPEADGDAESEPAG